ncbi:hypothetical protein [Peribacillus sp. FSL P2-0133]|uniref:spermine/spermidine synthase domain-containing protein n=1 Tax=Peribacillus sp. FSL P2-0133 TaxID=2921573 RepID=UPI0030CFC21A
MSDYNFLTSYYIQLLSFLYLYLLGSEDAKKFILRELQPYKVIIIDFPDPVDPVISSLYTIELFSQTAKILSKQGVLVCQSNSPEDTPTVFWSIGKTINMAGLNTLEYNVIVPSFGLWGFHLASHFKLPRIIPSISIQHQALTSDMRICLLFLRQLRRNGEKQL